MAGVKCLVEEWQKYKAELAAILVEQHKMAEYINKESIEYAKWPQQLKENWITMLKINKAISKLEKTIHLILDGTIYKIDDTTFVVSYFRSYPRVEIRKVNQD